MALTAVLVFNANCARRAAEIGSALRRTGKSIGSKDMLIAGTALEHGATLVTHNTAEFKRVRGLRLEDWFQPAP